MGRTSWRSWTCWRSPPRRQDSRRRSPPRRKSPASRIGEAPPDQIMTLFVHDLPNDLRDDIIQEDLSDLWKPMKVLRAMVLRKGDRCSAFVRFETRDDAKRALEDLEDGRKK